MNFQAIFQAIPAAIAIANNIITQIIDLLKYLTIWSLVAHKRTDDETRLGP